MSNIREMIKQPYSRASHVKRQDIKNIVNKPNIHKKQVAQGSDGKESACNAGDPGFDPWVGKIPWRRKWQPTPVFLPREFHRAWQAQSMGSQRGGHN